MISFAMCAFALILQHCCAKVRLPLPPSELGLEGKSIVIKLEGVPHSARKPAATVAPNWDEASLLEYPASGM